MGNPAAPRVALVHVHAMHAFRQQSMQTSMQASCGVTRFSSITMQLGDLGAPNLSCFCYIWLLVRT
jgi:hypothetical protein